MVSPRTVSQHPQDGMASAQPQGCPRPCTLFAGGGKALWCWDQVPAALAAAGLLASLFPPVILQPFSAVVTSPHEVAFPHFSLCSQPEIPIPSPTGASQSSAAPFARVNSESSLRGHPNTPRPLQRASCSIAWGNWPQALPEVAEQDKGRTGLS